LASTRWSEEKTHGNSSPHQCSPEACPACWSNGIAFRRRNRERPSDCAIHTALDPDSTRSRDTALATGWDLAAWTSTTTIATHLITGQDPGRYGLWLRITGVEGGHLTGEDIMLWVGTVGLTGD
jgi:hypothetical protein